MKDQTKLALSELPAFFESIKTLALKAESELAEEKVKRKKK